MNVREALQAAVESGEVISIIYVGGTQPGTKRRIAPVGVIGHHLRALALPQEETRTYLIDKVTIVSDSHPAPDYDPNLSPSKSSSRSKTESGNAFTVNVDLMSLPASGDTTRGEERKHALEGSYDPTFFQDREKRTFRFPKYDTGTDSLVRIKDKTRYNRDNFMMLEDVPLREYTIGLFEEDFFEAEFEVASIECLFRPKNKQHFAPFDYLTRAKAEVDRIENCLENRKLYPYVVADSKVFEQLEKDDFIRQVSLDQAVIVKQLESQYKKADLVQIADRHAVSGKGLKAELIQRLIAANVLKVPKAVLPTERFESLIVALIDVYLSEIRKSTDHFHPLYLEWMWEEVSGANFGQWEYLDARIDEIRNERYWDERLSTLNRPFPKKRKWWKFWE